MLQTGIRTIFAIGATFAAVGLMSIHTAHASQAELQDAYTAYQEAAATGDVRAALPHAERAYELGLELFGPDSRNTGLLAFNYGAAQNQTGAFEDALPVLWRAVAALGPTQETPNPDMASAYTEIGFTYLALGRGADAALALEAALATLGSEGVTTPEAAYANLLLATVPYRSRLSFVSPVPMQLLSAPRRAHPSILTMDTVQTLMRRDEESSLDEHQEVFEELLNQNLLPALTFYEQNSGDPLMLLDAQSIAAGLYTNIGDTGLATAYATSAMQSYLEAHYLGPFASAALTEWQYFGLPEDAQWEEKCDVRRSISHLRHYNPLAGELAYVLPDAPQPISRRPPEYPINAARQNRDGDVLLQFDIDERGHTQNIQVIESCPRGLFNNAAINAVRGFRYEPWIVDGEPTVRRNMRFGFEFRMEH